MKSSQPEQYDFLVGSGEAGKLLRLHLRGPRLLWPVNASPYGVRRQSEAATAL